MENVAISNHAAVQCDWQICTKILHNPMALWMDLGREVAAVEIFAWIADSPTSPQHSPSPALRLISIRNVLIDPDHVTSTSHWCLLLVLTLP